MHLQLPAGPSAHALLRMFEALTQPQVAYAAQAAVCVGVRACAQTRACMRAALRVWPEPPLPSLLTDRSLSPLGWGRLRRSGGVGVG